MNERIERLSQEAFAHAVVHGQDYKPQTDFDRVYDKKFAELIVRECVELVEGYTKQRTHTTFYKAEEQIKQHFGVEE